MKASNLVWGGIGALAIVLGLVEWSKGKTMLSVSAFVIGALLIATAVAGIRKQG